MQISVFLLEIGLGKLLVRLYADLMRETTNSVPPVARKALLDRNLRPLWLDPYKSRVRDHRNRFQGGMEGARIHIGFLFRLAIGALDLGL